MIQNSVTKRFIIMKRLFRTFIVTWAVAALFASCNNDIVPDVPDTPAEGKLVRLTFGTADAPGTRAVWKDETGKGNLIRERKNPLPCIR